MPQALSLCVNQWLGPAQKDMAKNLHGINLLRIVIELASLI